MATIRERPGKKGTSYQAQIRLPGSRLQTRTFKRKTDAKLWAQQAEAALRAGYLLPTAQNRRRTLGELIDRYINGPMKLVGGHSLRLQKLRWWEQLLGRETRLTNITPAQIMEARDRLAAGKFHSGKPCSPSTVRGYLAILSRCFTLAIEEWFWMEREQNPFLLVSRPAPSRGRVRFLSQDERHRLFEACRQSRDRRLYPLVVTAVASGARKNELLRLRWAQVDLKRGFAILNHTKNNDRRSVPISRPAARLLAELKANLLPYDLVFANSAGRATFPVKPWYRAMKAAELEDFRFHDLRHTAASYLAMSGATLNEIAEILGHRTLEMVKRYAHLTEQHSHRVAARMAEHFLDGDCLDEDYMNDN